MDRIAPGRLLIFSAPSGAGKTTIFKSLLLQNPHLRFSVSHTTRPPRGQEVHGQDYFFVSPEEFALAKTSGEFLEHVVVYQHAYGTGRTQMDQVLAQGHDLVLDLETEGALRVKNLYPASVTIFIMPPSMDALEKRLRSRAEDTEQQIAIRLQHAKHEIDQASYYDHVVINDNVERVTEEINQILQVNRRKL